VKEKMKDNLSTIVLSVFELIVGILLLIAPEAFTIGIVLLAGGALMIAGILLCMQYFRTEPKEASKKQLLLKSLISLLLGAFFVFKYDMIAASTALIAVAYGVLILLTGLSKVQWAVDMLRMDNKRWYFAAIGAVISIAAAVIILLNPFAAEKFFLTFTGVALVVEAVMDLTILILSSFITPKPQDKIEK